MTRRTAARRGVMTWLAARSIRQLVLGVGALVLLVSGLFGGLRKADAEPVAALKVDRMLTVEPLQLTVERARWTGDLGDPIGPARGGKRFLTVFAKIRSTSDQSLDSFVVQEALRIDGLSGFAKSQTSDDAVPSEKATPRVVVASDAVDLGNLNPGLTYEVAFIWEQSLSEPLPASLDLAAYQHGFRQSSLDDQENWFDSSVASVGTVPLEKYVP